MSNLKFRFGVQTFGRKEFNAGCADFRCRDYDGLRIQQTNKQFCGKFKEFYHAQVFVSKTQLVNLILTFVKLKNRFASQTKLCPQ